MTRFRILASGLLLLSCSLIGPRVTAAEATAAQVAGEAAAILKATGIQGGFVAHVECDDATLTEKLRANDRYLVHGIDRDADEVAAARARLRANAEYGKISVDLWDGKRLPYIDGMVNLIVSEDEGAVTRAEAERVLAPGGVAYLRQEGQWQTIRQPWPDDIDDWTHFLHDSTGNPVASDDRVGPPRHLQWIGSPRWSRHHDRMASMSALVSTGGRIFYIMDEGSRVSIQLPPDWQLIARDAFNGTVLWKRSIETWHSHLWPLKSGPTQLARRLVTVDDKVYVTLGLRAPVTALDAATGETLRTYQGSEGTEEMLLRDGVLVTLVNSGASETEDYAPKFNVGDQRRVSNEFLWNREPRQITAFDAQTGKEIWTHESPVTPLTMASDDERVYFHDGVKVVGIARESGDVAWSTIPIGRQANISMNLGPRLVIHDGVVLFAGGDRSMRAIDGATGEILWTAPKPRGGYQSPEDLLVSGGLVWTAPTTSGRDTGVFTGRDVRTGEVKVEFPPNVETYWFHHRCYIAKATDKYLLPSRTGIEFVDPQSQDWEIHHWVRGGCLYGVMPCNGLVYTPPHNCACYPEAKLFGLNALAPAAANRKVSPEVEGERLEKGPAFTADGSKAASPAETDWPTYRRDEARSGSTTVELTGSLAPDWTKSFDGRLSSPVVANGRLYVAEVDAHTIHALDAATGERIWSYTTGARVDSPPTVWRDRVVFGSSDGYVYNLRASDGVLAWRFRAAPRDERLIAFEQLESVWPVHGSVLVEEDAVAFVAGRSNFLDGGLRFLRLDAESGALLTEAIIDEKDPETNENIQARLQILNMPVGLPDVLSSDGESIYMRSQRFDREGRRSDLGPHSGQPAVQGSVQVGETRHLFAPMGFLDDTYFHRAYWVYGRSFAGGHGGYYQAGKYTPSGRLLVADQDTVYGFGRKPEYLKWTTPLEHQLFASSKSPSSAAREVADENTARQADEATSVDFGTPDKLDPTGKPLAVSAWVRADRPDGVVLAHGGPQNGYALAIRAGKPRFLVRAANELASAVAQKETLGDWVHLAGVLTKDKKVQLFIDGELAATAETKQFVSANPKQGFQIGADLGSSVGDYNAPLGFTGIIDEVQVFFGSVSPQEIKALASAEPNVQPENAEVVLLAGFDQGSAADLSASRLKATVSGVVKADGRVGEALQFTFRRSRGAGSFVEHQWTQDIPLLARALVKAGDRLVVAGPPDLIDEEESFQRLIARDPRVAEKLRQQQAALTGEQGGLMRVVSATDGREIATYQTDGLPVWDSLAVTPGRLYFTTEDGRVVSWKESPR